MVKVIEDRFEAHGAPYLVFRVHKEYGSDKVTGYLISHSYRGEDGEVKVVATDKTLAPAEGFEKAIEAAKAHGFDYVLIHDLDKLFPVRERPALRQAA